MWHMFIGFIIPKFQKVFEMEYNHYKILNLVQIHYFIQTKEPATSFTHKYKRLEYTKCYFRYSSIKSEHCQEIKYADVWILESGMEYCIQRHSMKQISLHSLKS